MEKNILNLLLMRDTFTTKSTLGKLYINGQFFCYTLEDVVRGKGIKINKETAIETGCYPVKITYSNRFKRNIPILSSVPLFTGIRLHGGNKADNTDGCILIAYNKINNDTIQGTAEKDLTKILKKQNNEIILVIVNQIKQT